MAKLLIIDDEPNLLYSLQSGLVSEELEVLTATHGKQGLALIQEHQPDVLILDVRLKDQSGLELFDQIRQIDSRLPVIIITAFATTETAIEATKRGAFEYLLKPFDLFQLRELISRAVELRRIQKIPTVFARPEGDELVEPIVGQSPIMHEVYKAIGRVASEDVPVLILGESGTGKELVARAIFHHSKRKDKLFLAMNCAAIPDTLLESELFGHERGAYTGADRQRIGKFEQANGGTLFLDEIGDMSPTTQAKVLRLLQDQQFERIGGQQVIQTDVRIIAATNQSLDQMVSAGKFRQDLLYRLNGYTIHLPPLRDRKSDIPLLVDHFIRMANTKMEKQVHSVSPQALQLLENYTWPGNVRELQNAIRYGVIQTIGEVLTPECLPLTVRGTFQAPVENPNLDQFDLIQFVRGLLASGTPDIYRRVLHEVDRVVLAQILEFTKDNQVHASQLLGISRTTLRNKLLQNATPIE